LLRAAILDGIISFMRIALINSVANPQSIHLGFFEEIASLLPRRAPEEATRSDEPFAPASSRPSKGRRPQTFSLKPSDLIAQVGLLFAHRKTRSTRSIASILTVWSSHFVVAEGANGA
jgi:hypothetical protein